jgi:hypothetical protein
VGASTLKSFYIAIDYVKYSFMLENATEIRTSIQSCHVLLSKWFKSMIASSQIIFFSSDSNIRLSLKPFITSCLSLTSVDHYEASYLQITLKIISKNMLIKVVTILTNRTLIVSQSFIYKTEGSSPWNGKIYGNRSSPPP